MLDRPISKAGWTRVAFGDVVRKVNDKVDPWDSGLERYVAGEHMDTDDLRIQRWGLIGDDYLGPAFHMRFKPGHVLYGSRRTYLRKVALADFEGITANTTFVLETKDPARLMPELLPFLMQTEAFHSHSIKHSKGSVNPYINFSDLEAFEFLLPPIQEQARLVEALSATLLVSRSIETVRSKSERSGFSLFFNQLKSASDTVTGEIDDYCKFITDGDHNPPPRTASGIPYIVVNCLRDGEISLDTCSFVSEADFQSIRRRYDPNDGDVLLSCVGSLGAVAVVRDGLNFAADRSLAIYRPKLDRVSPDFLAAFLQSPASKNYFEAVATGTAQKHLYLSDLRRQKVAIPPLKAQSEIMRDFKKFRFARDCAENRKTEVTNIFKKILLNVVGENE